VGDYQKQSSREFMLQSYASATDEEGGRGEQVTLNVSITEGLTKVHLLGSVSKKLTL
jgi:hypothetical protein